MEQKNVQINYIDGNLFISIEDDSLPAKDLFGIVSSKCDVSGLMSLTVSNKNPVRLDYYTSFFSMFNKGVKKQVEIIDFLPSEILELSSVCDTLIINIDTSAVISLDDFFSAVALLNEERYQLKLITDEGEVAEIKRLLDKYGIRRIIVDEPKVMKKFLSFGFTPEE